MDPISMGVIGIGAAYTGGMSYFIRATNLDQRVFDFVAPKFSHACAFGAIFGLSQIILVKVKVLNATTIEKEDKTSKKHLTAYEIDPKISLVISAFGSAFLLRQMNYTMPYLFAVICLIPLAAKVALVKSKSD